MTRHAFDRSYWDEHWSGRGGAGSTASAPNPHLLREVTPLSPGTALDAGCGSGAEAVWLAEQGWHVTGADIAQEALDRAAERAAARGVSARTTWILADLSTWVPDRTFDLVTTHYAHPAMPQLDFYARLATWVAPGGTLLVVGHLRAHGHGHGHGHRHGHADESGEPPTEATVSAADIAARLDPAVWEVVTAEESAREVPGPDGRPRTLRDAVVRATRVG